MIQFKRKMYEKNVMYKLKKYIRRFNDIKKGYGNFTK